MIDGEGARVGGAESADHANIVDAGRDVGGDGDGELVFGF